MEWENSSLWTCSLRQELKEFTKWMREQEVDLASHPSVAVPPLSVKSGIHFKIRTGYHPPARTSCYFGHFSLGNSYGHIQLPLGSMFLLNWKNCPGDPRRSSSLKKNQYLEWIPEISNLCPREETHLCSPSFHGLGEFNVVKNSTPPPPCQCPL